MNSTILDQSDLALIRAALRFWLDEMSPHDDAAWEKYFATDEADQDGSSLRTAQLLKTLESVELRYFVVDNDNSGLSSVSLDNEAHIPSKLPDDSVYGTALLPKHD